MKIIVVGAGAAGFFSAIHIKENNPKSDVVLIEKGNTVLAKVKVSGGGRCNVTHACFDPRDLVGFYPRGAKELLGPFHSFQPSDTMSWFEDRGVPLKIENDNRVFPVSNQSQSIMDCLVATAEKVGVKLWTGSSVSSIQKEAHSFVVSLENGEDHCVDKVVLATGSNRHGYGFAKSLGHRIVDPIPSLFTLKINDPDLHKLSGVSVADAEVYLEGEPKQSQRGPLLITHWGVSGPAIIKLSAWRARELSNRGYQTRLHVNFLPEEDVSLPQRLLRYLGDREPTKCEFPVNGKGVFKEEFVTCGGVALNEINFKTMESKVCPGLHIVGELLDIDGVTGGFNFQNAWTTGYLSGKLSK